jgi:GT2 family glycosyltransferase
LIAFGCAITEEAVWRRWAKPGIDLVREPDSLVLAQASNGSIFRNYNLLMERVADRDDLEALVLVHQDSEIVDPHFCSTLREALAADPDVAVVGCAGSVGVRSIAWWEGSPTWGSFTHRYEEFGGGEIPAMSWDMTKMPDFARTGEVDTIDGFVIGLSPWAVRNLRFDESLGSRLHGYDFDFCLTTRAAGKKVVTANLRVVHHHSLALLGNPEEWIEAHKRVAEKWEGQFPDEGASGLSWKERARHSEAEVGAVRLQMRALEHISDARGLQDRNYIRELEGEIADMRASSSWRLTAPARSLGRLLKRRRSAS